MPKTTDLARKILLAPNIKKYIDLNTDLGQSRDKAFFEKTDYKLLNFVTSVNIPCCVHDGDPMEVITAIRQAKRYNCVVGAHIGYPDPARVGYEPMDIPAEELAAWIYVQLGAFAALLESEGLAIEHVRPHGALYTAFIDKPDVAAAVAKAVYRMSNWYVLVGPAGPILDDVQKNIGIRTAGEVQLGKRYNEHGQLVLGRVQDTLPPQGVLDQAKQLIHQGKLTTEDGRTSDAEFKSLHISPTLTNSIEVAEKVGQMLVQPVSLPLADIGASGWL